jgi:hypothetical protein
LAVRNARAFGEDRQRTAAADMHARLGHHRPQPLGPRVAHHRDVAIGAGHAAPAGDAEQLLLGEWHRIVEQVAEVDRLEEALVLDRIEHRLRLALPLLADDDAEDIDHAPAVAARPRVGDRAETRARHRHRGDQRGDHEPYRGAIEYEVEQQAAQYLHSRPSQLARSL